MPSLALAPALQKKQTHSLRKKNYWFAIHHTSSSKELDVKPVCMKLNKAWHKQHTMPKNATLDERIAWHIEHAKHCSCREMPDKIKEEIKRREKKTTSV
jgi:hypothetical protein